MSIFDLFSLQGTLFGIMLVGALLKKKGMIDENGKRCLTDICVNAIIPCNIFKSCLIEFNMGIFRSCAMLMLSALWSKHPWEVVHALKIINTNNKR